MKSVFKHMKLALRGIKWELMRLVPRKTYPEGVTPADILLDSFREERKEKARIASRSKR